MKLLVCALVVFPNLAFALPAQDPKSTCLYVPNLGQTDIVDENTMVFHMRDHSVYRVSMQTRCFGLKHEPDGYTFIQDSLATENVCANQATIRLNSIHTTCELGNFTRIK